MLRFRKFLLTVAILGGIALFAAPSTARASIELQLSEQGVSGTITQSSSNSGDTVSYSGTVGNDFKVNIAEGDSNSPGGSTALTEEGTIKITNNSSSNQTITITVSAQDFTSPTSPPPLTILDTVSGSVATGSLVSGTAQGFADATNALFGTGFAGTKLTFGPNGASTSFAADGNKGGFTNSGKYSLTFTETFTLAGNSSITLTGGNVQATPTPAPAGFVLALTGLPLFGIGAWVRRRRQA